MTVLTLHTPQPGEVDALELAAELLGFVGFEQPTYQNAADLIELIANALGVVQPDNGEMAACALNLAAHFHAWADTVRGGSSYTSAIAET